MKRILGIGTATGGGDLPPFIAVLAGLQRRGHIVLCNGEAGLAKMVGSELVVKTFAELKDLSEYRRVWEGVVATSGDHSSHQPFQFEWMKDLLPHIRRLVRTFKPDILVCTGFTLCVGATLRDELDIPLCWINSSFYFGPHSDRSYVEDFIPESSVYVNGALPYYDRVDVIIHNTDVIFDPPPKRIPSNHFWVGPLLWEPDMSSPTYLDQVGDPWVLATLSTYRQDEELVLGQRIVDALAEFNLRTLLTLGDAESQEIIRYSGNSVHVEGFVPHRSVLRRASLSISHAGYGIVSKSMYHGVPMILVPWGRDQRGVAARAEACGVAIVIRKELLSTNCLKRAITQALEDPALRGRALERRDYLRSLDPVATASERIEQLLEP